MRNGWVCSSISGTKLIALLLVESYLDYIYEAAIQYTLQPFLPPYGTSPQGLARQLRLRPLPTHQQTTTTSHQQTTTSHQQTTTSHQQTTTSHQQTTTSHQHTTLQHTSPYPTLKPPFLLQSAVQQSAHSHTDPMIPRAPRAPPA
jgi:hypothetical protein